MKLTEKQQKVLQYLIDFNRENGYQPSIHEIADNFKYKSTNSVDGHLKAIERKGFIKRTHKISRAIKILNNKVHS